MKRNFTVRHGALDGLEAFLCVAQHRSFRRAASELNVTPSAISQAVRTLEARLGAVLLTRTTRSVGLTEVGEKFLVRAKPAFAELVAAGEAARESSQRPAGTLRLSAPRAVVPILLQPLVASFRVAYPQIEVEIAVSEKLVDLVADGFDAGVRPGQVLPPDMVAVRLSPPFRLVIVGTQGYLTRSGRPERPEDLRNHACLRLRRSGGALARWVLKKKGGTVELAVSGPFIANDFLTLLEAALEGQGLAQVPEPIAAAALAAGRLVHVLEPFAPLTPGVFLYHPHRRQVTPKLRAFIDHIKSRAASGKRGK